MKTAIKTINGVTFRLRSVPAMIAKQLLDAGVDNLREYIDVKTPEGWIPLDNDFIVDKSVGSWEELLLLDMAAFTHNFGFLESWKPVKIPVRMQAGGASVEMKYMDPLFGMLIGEGLASFIELQTELSLNDAFMLLEVRTVKAINEYMASNPT